MTESEFWEALEQVFGPALGHSLVQDLYISGLVGTPGEALARGVKPDEVWEALIAEVGAGEEARWIHRSSKRRTD